MSASVQSKKSHSPLLRKLAAGALALGLGGAVLAQMAPPHDGGMGGHGGHGKYMRHGGGGHGMGGHGMGMMGGGRMLDKVGATAEQKTKLQAIFKAAHEDTQKLREGERDLHDQAAKLLAAPAVDARALEVVRVKLQASHDEASKRHFKAMTDAATVLTPEQRQKMAQDMQAHRDMKARHMQEHQHIDGSAKH